MTEQIELKEPEELTEYTAVQDPKSEIPNPKSEMEIVVLENSETGVVTFDTSA